MKGPCAESQSLSHCSCCQLWCHGCGNVKGGDGADEEVNVVVTQSRMGCAGLKASYSYIKPNI